MEKENEFTNRVTQLVVFAIVRAEVERRRPVKVRLPSKIKKVEIVFVPTPDAEERSRAVWELLLRGAVRGAKQQAQDSGQTLNKVGNQSAT